MTALTADAIIPIRGREHADVRSYPVADNVKIFKGSLVMFSSGYAAVGADTASAVCCGIAMEQADNTVTGHTAGGIRVRCASNVHALLVGSGLAQTDVGAQVKIADSATIAKTSTNNVNVGRITEFISATSVWVEVSTPGFSQGA